MTKKIFGKTVFALLVGVGITTAAVMDPNTRMEKVRELFTQYGADTFKILNDLGVGGTGTSEGGKSLQIEQRGDVANVIKSEDGNSFVFCVVDGKWAVYPPEPMKIGTNAMTATDSHGMPFVQTMISALRNSPTGKAHGVPYAVNTPGGIQHRYATVWNSRNLLSRKNDTGKKFFCGTSIKASS